MSWLKALFGSSGLGSGPKIYQSQILDIPGARFSRRVQVKTGSGEKYLEGGALRDYLAGLARGGISLSSLDKRLNKAGVRGGQYERRQEIIRIIKSETGNK